MPLDVDSIADRLAGHILWLEVNDSPTSDARHLAEAGCSSGTIIGVSNAF